MAYQITAPAYSTEGSAAIAMRCPICGDRGTFAPVQKDLIPDGQDYRLGHRLCPNPKCGGHVFLVANEQGTEILATYPPNEIAIDPTSIPERIISVLMEAVACHSVQAHRGAAMLVRRSL